MRSQRKGIILAGGVGSRLHPITLSVSKQLLAVYDKPMIYYPLSVLMLAKIREIAVITTPQQQSQFIDLLGDGSSWGLRFDYISQPSPDGLAQAYLLAEDFLAGCPSAMILGDNIFYGGDLISLLSRADARHKGGTVFGYRVTDPERYGVVEFNSEGEAVSIEEKPENPKSNFAVTGLYFLDETAPEQVRHLIPSARGELEIVCLLDEYLKEHCLVVERLNRGYAWLDTGTHDSLMEAGEYVRTIQHRQGLLIGSPEEIAYRNGWIDKGQLLELGSKLGNTAYAEYLIELAQG